MNTQTPPCQHVVGVLELTGTAGKQAKERCADVCAYRDDYELENDWMSFEPKPRPLDHPWATARKYLPHGFVAGVIVTLADFADHSPFVQGP